MLGVFFTHFMLLVFGRVLVILLLFLFVFILLLIVFLVFILVVFIVLVVILIILLWLFLLELLAQGEVVARLIIRRIVSQAFLIGFNSLAVHLVILADNSDIMICLRPSELVCLDTPGLLKLLYGSRVFLLHEQSAAKIVMGLSILPVM